MTCVVPCLTSLWMSSFFLSKFSFASSIKAFHSFSRIMGGRSFLRPNCNFSLFWALVYFKFSLANFVTTLLLNVLSNKFTCGLSIHLYFFYLGHSTMCEWWGQATPRFHHSSFCRKHFFLQKRVIH
jgi:hypothetical protein